MVKRSRIRSATVLLAVALLLVLAGCGGGSGPAADAKFRVFFTSDATGTPQIYEMISDGTGLTQLTTVGTNEYPSVTRDGTKVVYQSTIAAVKQVCIMNSDGSGVTQLTNAASDSMFPSISGDGSKITFRRDQEIWVMDADGDNQTNVTGTGHTCYSSALNYNATKIVFNRGAGAFYHLFTMNADGSNEVDITPANMDAFDAEFNPSGTKVVFWGHDTTIWDMQLVSVNLANNAKTSLPHSTENRNPSFSPDGRSVVFDCHEGGKQHLYIVHGSSISQLTNNAWNDYGASCTAE